MPPSPPTCRIPPSVRTGGQVLLSCHDNDGSPPPTYKWYKGATLLPEDPKKFPQFKNATYKMDPVSGNLVSDSSSSSSHIVITRQGCVWKKKKRLLKKNRCPISTVMLSTQIFRHQKTEVLKNLQNVGCL